MSSAMLKWRVSPTENELRRISASQVGQLRDMRG